MRLDGEYRDFVAERERERTEADLRQQGTVLADVMKSVFEKAVGAVAPPAPVPAVVAVAPVAQGSNSASGGMPPFPPMPPMPMAAACDRQPVSPAPKSRRGAPDGHLLPEVPRPQRLRVAATLSPQWSGG
jgi:hypothetical protein